MDEKVIPLTNFDQEEEEEIVLAKAQAIVTGRVQQKPKPSSSRPMISAGLDDNDWTLFKDSWDLYKISSNVVDLPSVRMELRAACSEEVNRLLSQFVGSISLKDCSEEEYLRLIKSVAVKSAHKEEHQLDFNTMMQNSGESVSNFVARLKAKAALCGFEVTCTKDHDKPCRISYAEQMVSQRLIAGLENQGHQKLVIAECHTLPTLEDRVRHLQMLEIKDEAMKNTSLSDVPHERVHFNLDIIKHFEKFVHADKALSVFNYSDKDAKMPSNSPTGRETYKQADTKPNIVLNEDDTTPSEEQNDNNALPQSATMSDASSSLRKMLTQLEQMIKKPD